MVERVPDSDYDPMQHFISKSPWDAQGVMNLVCEKTYQTLKSTDSGVSLGLLLDESGWKKSGKNQEKRA